MPFCFTDQRNGDLAIDVDAATLDARRGAIVAAPWTWLQQVHGARVVIVTEPGEHAGEQADAAVTAVPGAPVAVQVADCTPVVLRATGAVGVVHAGWRGLAAGVVGRAVDALVSLGVDPGSVVAEIGPCIRPRCYAFSAEDLERVASVVGPEVRSTTAWGTPALDVAGGVRASLARAGVIDVVDCGVCTACSPLHWSHRARGDRGRQAAVAWVEP